MSQPPGPDRDHRPSRAPTVRDMEMSAFAKILTDLLARVPGAFACALVDSGGETVDYAGKGEVFDVKVAAAHMRILVNELERLGALGTPRALLVRGTKRTLLARILPDGYALVVLLRRRAGFAASTRAFAACERALAVEAGWPASTGGTAWFPVTVEVDPRGRPRRVGQPGVETLVLGAVVGLPPGEKGFRVRLATGGELTLVRERGDRWYADEAVAADRPAGAGPLDLPRLW
ncbi:MAG: hypothetical protein JWP97_5568 [Labilithrix sp.]|nr:hypothetical protein [Labilithrix sp.]